MKPLCDISQTKSTIFSSSQSWHCCRHWPPSHFSYPHTSHFPFHFTLLDSSMSLSCSLSTPCLYFSYVLSEHIFLSALTFLRISFRKLFSHLYIVLFYLTGLHSVYHLSCIPFPQMFPKSPLGIFSFYSHRASSVPISLPLVYLHLISCIYTTNIFFILCDVFCSSFQ